jgi:hypothetical protein
MLCDEIVGEKYLPTLYDGLDKVIAKVAKAQKFILSREFCVAADGLVENMEELDKVVPFCMLPYPLMWVEFLHDDRPHWDPSGPHGARPVDPSRHQGSPSRVGFLLEQQDADPGIWTAHLFWRLRNIPANVVEGTFLNGSLMQLQFDCNAEIEGEKHIFSAVRPYPAEFGFGLLTEMMATEPDIGRRLLEYAQEDWGGEYRFLVAILGLLNSRNVAETVKVDKEPENVKRRKHGKRTLFSHNIIKVRPFIVAGGKAQTGQHKDLRLHFVRGHFKHRKTGLFWWSMHARGDKAVGIVEKEYEVEGK